jgi:hypothetical protein
MGRHQTTPLTSICTAQPPWSGELIGGYNNQNHMDNCIVENQGCQDDIKSASDNSSPRATRNDYVFRRASDRYTGIRLVRPTLQNIRALLIRIQKLIEASPFLIDNNSNNPTHFNTSSHCVETSDGSETMASNQVAGECNPTPSTPSRRSPPPYRRKLIFQQRPYTNAIKHPVYGLRRSFVAALDTYDHAAKKEYILLMRNFAITQKYPDYHIIVNHFRPMFMRTFAKLLTKAFEHLVRLNVSGYYVHEPTPCRNWLHTHIMATYDGSIADLRTCIKYVFMDAGLTEGIDFQVKIFPVSPTDRDYKGLCCYVLKFNGRRKENRFNPVLFVKGLGLRKIGTFGRWFAELKAKMWVEYIEEQRLKHGQKKTTRNDGFKEQQAPNTYNRRLTKEEIARQAAAPKPPPPPEPAEIIDTIWRILRRPPDDNNISYDDLLWDLRDLHYPCDSIEDLLNENGFEVQTLADKGWVVNVEYDPVEDRAPAPFSSLQLCILFNRGEYVQSDDGSWEYPGYECLNVEPEDTTVASDTESETDDNGWCDIANYGLPYRSGEVAELFWNMLRCKSGAKIINYTDVLYDWKTKGGTRRQLLRFLLKYGFVVQTIDGVKQIVNVIPNPVYFDGDNDEHGSEFW